MNLEQLQALLQYTRGHSPEFGSLADAFEGFLELYLVRNQKHKDQKKFQEKLHGSFRNLWDTFDRVAESKGLNVSDIRQHFADPSNFSTEQWQQIETAKEDLQHLEASPVSKRHKKQKKTVRI